MQRYLHYSVIDMGVRQSFKSDYYLLYNIFTFYTILHTLILQAIKKNEIIIINSLGYGLGQRPFCKISLQGRRSLWSHYKMWSHHEVARSWFRWLVAFPGPGHWVVMNPRLWLGCGLREGINRVTCPPALGPAPPGGYEGEGISMGVWSGGV